MKQNQYLCLEKYLNEADTEFFLLINVNKTNSHILIWFKSKPFFLIVNFKLKVFPLLLQQTSPSHMFSHVVEFQYGYR